MSRSLDQWLAFAESVHPRSIEMGLTRVRAVAERLALVPWRIPSIIVAGTNGKGSVTISAQEILLAGGFPTGAGFSPHLHRFNERIRIGSAPAEDALLVRGFEAVDAARGDIPLTYFEFATLVSLWVWRHCAMACTVLEIGLGGRLDAFNIVDAEVAVVTSIGLDHQEYLGDTRELIGAEKAGVFRPGQRVVLGRDMPASVITRARELACETLCSGTDVRVDDREDALLMHATGELPWALDGLLDVVMPTALAPHNVALAVMAAAALKPLTPDAVVAGVSRAALPGRVERIQSRERTFVLDIAHNPAGAEFLARRLSGLGLEPEVAIIGNLRDKDSAGIAAPLAARIPEWISVSTPGPRGQDASQTLQAVQRTGARAASAALSMDEALACAVQRSRRNGVILVFGSFAAVGAAREALLGAEAG